MKKYIIDLTGVERIGDMPVNPESLRARFNTVTPAIKAALTEYGGAIERGGCDYGIEGAPGQFLDVILVTATEQSVAALREIEGLIVNVAPKYPKPIARPQ